MILKWLKLKNIRSYPEQELHFPEGSVLLSGDIGAGKTTLLLSIEFALFGIIRGDLTGATLLRHGAMEGEVSLCFSVEKNKNIIITRTLKKSGKTIVQSAGTISVNDVVKDATAIELKSDILELLGYPESLLTKNTSLVYRYTVYTPQEEMKHILFDDPEGRLDTLRKLFGMDSYKNIQENCSCYLKELRDHQKLLFHLFHDLEEKQKEAQQKEQDLLEHEQIIAQKKPELAMLQKQLSSIQEKLQQQEKEIQKFSQYREQLVRCEERTHHLLQQRSARQERIALLKKHLQEKSLPSLPAPELIEQEILSLDHEISQSQKTLHSYQQKIGSYTAKIDAGKTLAQHMHELATCPVCLQEVSDQHKKNVLERQQQETALLKEQLISHEQTIQKLENDFLNKKELLSKKRQQLKESTKQHLTLTLLSEKEKEILELEKSLSKDKEVLAQINKEKLELNTFFFNAQHIQNEFINLKKEHEILSQKERTLFREATALEESLKNKINLLALLKKEIFRKEESKKEYEQSKLYHQWLAGYFLPLVENIERHVMTKLYHDFNQRFQQWFSILLEDIFIQARLDTTFSPLIIQDGYETEISQLSGGEKTSCALAYRLALTKVVNDLLPTVKTKDLLILDEPTDGFSAQQIQKIGEVLEELHLAQVIIVSHEPSIESMVDQVIKVEKRDQKSFIA